MRSPLGWSQEAYLKSSNATLYGGFGSIVSLADDASSLLVTAASERGIDSKGCATLPAAGAAYRFARAPSGWSQTERILPPKPASYDRFGSSAALAGDGASFAIAAWDEMNVYR